MNKQPGSTLSTTINRSRSCYITVKGFAFLSVETTFARTIHISNNILNWFWTLSKNVNLWAKRQEKGICLIFKRNIAHLAHRRTLRTLIIASAERLKSLWTILWTIHVPNEKKSAVVIPTISYTTHCNCSQKCHTCKQQNIDYCRDVWLCGNSGWQLLWEWIDHRIFQTLWWKRRKSCSFQTETII